MSLQQLEDELILRVGRGVTIDGEVEEVGDDAEPSSSKVTAKKDGKQRRTTPRCLCLQVPSIPQQPLLYLLTTVRTLMGVAPYLVQPFLIIEDKTSSGSMNVAENQVIRLC